MLDIKVSIDHERDGNLVGGVNLSGQDFCETAKLLESNEHFNVRGHKETPYVTAVHEEFARRLNSHQLELREIANRTYVEEQTELQRSIFSKYNKRKRPVKNSSEPLDVAIHVYLMHLSVNQLEQTITLNGHIYMTWKDEYAVWEPSEHNGVRTTMVKQWEIWTPELRPLLSDSYVKRRSWVTVKTIRPRYGNAFKVIDRSFCIAQRTTVTHLWEQDRFKKNRAHFLKSAVEQLFFTSHVSGVGQYFEISKRSHVIIQSNGKAWSRVEVYPTFSIKVGCSFDFSSYPYDRQRCALGIFTTYRMSDKVSTNLSYYSNGKYSSVRPVDPEQLDVSWSILYTWLYLKRNAFCFGLGVLLPSMIAYMFVIFSFLLPSPESSIYILIANLFLLGVFLEDLITMLPPTIGRAPRIVYFTGLNLVLTTIAIGIQFWLRYILKAPGNASGWALHVIRVRNMLTPQRWKAESIKAVDGDEEQFTSLFHFFSKVE
ncbi:unnamed protein product [Toxocara canis]|uniref:Neur_chan_LBD domain-containing protein n=1 Tax=Toxocara canis TaxID=6265 RepID=A0A183UGT1_TOXCA|nr:unnamed protein product [Toxocara canis]